MPSQLVQVLQCQSAMKQPLSGADLAAGASDHADGIIVSVTLSGDCDAHQSCSNKKRHESALVLGHLLSLLRGAALFSTYQTVASCDESMAQ